MKPPLLATRWPNSWLSMSGTKRLLFCRAICVLPKAAVSCVTGIDTKIFGASAAWRSVVAKSYDVFMIEKAAKASATCCDPPGVAGNRLLTSAGAARISSALQTTVSGALL